MWLEVPRGRDLSTLIACRRWACWLRRLPGRPVAVAASPAGRTVVDRRTDRLRRSHAGAARQSRVGGRACVADRGGQPRPGSRGLAGSTSAAGQALSGRRGPPGARRQQRPAAWRTGASGRSRVGARSDSPQLSLSIASGKVRSTTRPTAFGVIRAKKVIAANNRSAPEVDGEGAGHVPRRDNAGALEELDDGESTTPTIPTCSPVPVGGGGFLGKWLKKMLSSARKSGGAGGGPPGADAPTHRTNSANRGAYAVSSTAAVSSEESRRRQAGRRQIPRVGRQPQELSAATGALCAKSTPKIKAVCAAGDRRRDRRAAPAGASRHGPASPPPPVAGRRHRHRCRGRGTSRGAWPGRCPTRRSISTACGAGATCRCCCCSMSRVRRPNREPLGRTVHQQQRPRSADLTVALHDLGDRVALYAYYSQGRTAVMVAGQAIRRPSRRPGDQAAEQPRAGRIFATRRSHPARFGGP